MRSNDFLRLCVLFLILTLNVPVDSLDWQGSGNMSESNMTEIQTAINSNPITSATGSIVLNTIAQNISTHLNTLWDPAWNVIISKGSPGFDTVLYGYAFRNHWMWINSVPISGTTTSVLAYVIWKDYNCQTWSTVSNLLGSSKTFTT